MSYHSDQQARYMILSEDSSEPSVTAHYSRRPAGDAQSDCLLLVLQPERAFAQTVFSAPDDASSHTP
jgi:hypothetical protein